MFLSRVVNHTARLQILSRNNIGCLSLFKQIHVTSKVNAGKSSDATGHAPDIWDKRMLVWMKKYPNVESVPSNVPLAQMEKTRSQVRIRVNIILMIITVIGSYTFYTYGKKQAKEGDTVFSRRQKEQEAASSS